jgi:ATP-dependent Clp protease ATP-binding subunit ClpB
MTDMNSNQLTIKSQEALQKAQEVVQEYGQQQIENAQLFLAIAMVD